VRRLLLLLLAALLVLVAAPAAALAQEEPDDEPDAVATPDGDPESVPTPDPVCDRGGPDADYAYCDPCPSPDADYQSDGDYAYCAAPAGGDDEEGGGGPPPRAPRPLAAGQLPVTGSEPSLLALLGLGLLLAGTGLRLRLTRA